MKIKTKLTIGLGFLFAVIVLIGTVAVIYINTIANDSKEILKDNYESVQISKAMLRGIDAPGEDTAAFLATLEKNLNMQEKNITEPGEKEYTNRLRRDFNSAKQNGYTAERLKGLKNSLYEIMDLNMHAILEKSNQVQEKSNAVLLYIGVIGAFCFIIVFTFIINFPGYIANPIKELTASIRQISEKKYDQRLEFSSKDEFGELAEAFNVMAEKLKQYESSNIADVMFEKQRIETIINNMNDAIIGLNENKCILFANIQAVKLIGLTESEMLGKYASNLSVNNTLLRTIIGKGAEQQPISVFVDSKKNYFSKENIEIYSEGKAIGEVILLKNITRYKELDQAKTNFIATISHELKTPIASIKLSSKLLEDDRVGDLNAEQHQLVTNIKEDSERLLKITGEVLNMAQVETGKIQLNFQRIKADSIISYAIESLKVQAEQKHIAITCRLPDNLPEIYADLEKTVWVLVNLLSNAIRYSPENSNILLTVSKKDQQIRFSVQDFGKGIEPQYKDKIFNKFFQVPGSSKSGTGLGLAIAKEFILAQKGTISMDSTVGKGTVFFFQLPVA